MEDVAGGDHQLAGHQTNLLAVVVHSLTDLDQHLFQRSLGQVGGSCQQVAERTVHDGVRSAVQSDAVTTSVLTASEGVVQHVSGQSLFGLDQRLSEVASVDLTDTDVVTVLDQHFGQREGQAKHVIHIALEEQHATLLVRHWSAVRHLRCCTKAVQDRLFVVVAWDAFLLAEDARPFIGTLIVDTVEALVQNGFDNATKVGTAHWSGHDSLPP